VAQARAASYDFPAEWLTSMTELTIEIDGPLGRRARAVACARAAVAALREKGVVALITGSLAEGKFRDDSDIDLLVIECPRSLKYAIEGIVEDCLPGYDFDVVYLEEIPTARRAGFVSKARDVADIR
jgi:predicted nucleotidyltransferase